MAPKTEKKAFNVAFGKVLQMERNKKGFRNAEAFAAHVQKTAGISFSLDTLRRIESGRQPATVEQYAAIRLALSGAINDDFLELTARRADSLIAEQAREKEYQGRTESEGKHNQELTARGMDYIKAVLKAHEMLLRQGVDDGFSDDTVKSLSAFLQSYEQGDISEAQTFARFNEYSTRYYYEHPEDDSEPAKCENRPNTITYGKGADND